MVKYFVFDFKHIFVNNSLKYNKGRDKNRNKTHIIWPKLVSLLVPPTFLLLAI